MQPFARFRTIVLPALLAFLAGCAAIPQPDAARKGPYFNPANVHSVVRLPADVRRIVVLPVAADGGIPEESLDALDMTIRAALNLTGRFEIAPVSRAVCARYTGMRSIRSIDALPHDFFTRLTNEFAAEAVLFIDVTQYTAYPPLALGLRCKLARLNDRSLLWSFDTLYTATNPAVVNSARRHWLETTPTGTPADLSATALQSPQRFAAYAAAATFATLPPR
ncbi:MAG: hypothetical protein HZA31_07590 [Opitutae bacterium]|nr:hypothetical protein [Opitutae bacterium]